MRALSDSEALDSWPIDTAAAAWSIGSILEANGFGYRGDHRFWYARLGYCLELVCDILRDADRIWQGEDELSPYSGQGPSLGTPFSDRHLLYAWRGDSSLFPAVVNLGQAETLGRGLVLPSWRDFVSRARNRRVSNAFRSRSSIFFQDFVLNLRDWSRLNTSAERLVGPPPRAINTERGPDAQPPLDLPLRRAIAQAIQELTESQVVASVVAFLLPYKQIEWVTTQGEQQFTDNSFGFGASFVGTPPWVTEGRHFLANAISSGAKVHLTQHGGRYGQLAPTPEERYETRTSDVFHSWWAGTSGQPLPSLRMHYARAEVSRKRDTRGGGSSEGPILWLLSGGDSRSIQSVRCGDDWILRQLFLDSIWRRLPSRIARRVLFRQNRRKHLILHERLPEGSSTRNANDGEFTLHLARAQIVVCGSVDSTALFEAIAVGKPVLSYWHNRPDFASPFKPIANELERLGVYNFTIDSFVETLEEACASPEEFAQRSQSAMREMLPNLIHSESPYDAWGKLLKTL